ncbi:MAG: histidine--tRNA ligase [Lentisphaerae bacterium]|jgi:histidyl-tRNA synthetase|nr:histidine--tRNA ligase [Lentisphaerota bacterium]MBT4822965.1 histidine--tRNA ligase [Lentisphaerota bacterium]MBT5609441.1 histidine--tRNA ligase [Lentisphaerota bacterium]MBT7061238.1 histidine--tRNA ligase [Lentisphaerota bacterium]MBT7848697.1 histidine--tRNA ligase [Lentisphaerota bacterium]
MAAQLEPLPGTSDLWEQELVDWVSLETCARETFSKYGYGELRTPVLERTKVFTRSLGDETDVVQKEMYTFEDRGGRSLTLRPEGTAGVIRAIANRGLATGEERRVFYMGPMFRGEKPAAGRKRQFHQIGVESVGKVSPWLDVECIAMLMRFLAELGIPNGRLLLNTRGLPEDRERVTAKLLEHFEPRLGELCADCQRRIQTNIWRILDCKEPGCQPATETAPRITDLLGPESQAFFETVCRGLEDLGIEFELSPRLVRGLDYYLHTVFEVVHEGLGAQDALAGGGRYAIAVPGSKNPIEGVGFAAGIERLLLARESLGVKAQSAAEADVYVISLGEAVLSSGLALAETLREAGLRVFAETTGRSLKAQMRAANRLGTRWALIRGDTEMAAGTVLCKNMTTSEQTGVPVGDVVPWITRPTCE